MFDMILRERSDAISRTNLETLAFVSGLKLGTQIFLGFQTKNRIQVFLFENFNILLILLILSFLFT